MLHSAAARLAAAVETPSLLLEPMGAHHADAFFLPLQDDRLYEWISMPRPGSVEALREQWRRIETRVSPDGRFAWQTWAVRRKADGAWLGRVDAEVNPDWEAPNFGYYFFPPYWGRGHATEAVRAASDALLRRGVQRLVATVTVGNTASARVLQKAGFVFTRLLPANDVVRGVAVDDEEYLKLPPA